MVRDDLLRVARHRVVFRICAKNRTGFAPARGDGVRQLAGTFLDCKAFRPQEIAIGSRRFVLAPGRFRVIPYALVKIGKASCVFVDPLERVTLWAGHRHHWGLLVGWLLRAASSPISRAKEAAEDFLKDSGGWAGADWVAISSL